MILLQRYTALFDYGRGNLEIRREEAGILVTIGIGNESFERRRHRGSLQWQCK